MRAFRTLALCSLLALGCGEGGGGVEVENPLTDPAEGPPAGNQEAEASCTVPAEAAPADTSAPTEVVGTGTPESCTSEAFVAAVAGGGIITFDCGPEPVTITLEETAKIVNDTGPEIVIDGGGLVTLSGAGQRRILYMNTCDQAQKWTTSPIVNEPGPSRDSPSKTSPSADGNAKSENLKRPVAAERSGRGEVNSPMHQQSLLQQRL